MIWLLGSSRDVIGLSASIHKAMKDWKSEVLTKLDAFMVGTHPQGIQPYVMSPYHPPGFGFDFGFGFGFGPNTQGQELHRFGFYYCFFVFSVKTKRVQMD